LLDTRGRRSLEASRVQVPEMEAVDLVLPDVVFEKSLTLYQGKKTLHLWHTPGHSPDSIVCLVEPDRVLIAADTLMPIPFFQDGDDEQFLISLMVLQAESYEAIIQGHGEVILRGEVEEKFAEDINYLKCLHQSVDRVLAQAKPQVEADTIDIETCGKSRVLLNGMVEELHRQNVQMLLKKRQNLVQTRTSVT
jgi:glyoxylase-like metal-dependent hydrolase (beta-lactamase superfamily II)